ncbi:MAG: LysE family translocator [Mesorhizobium sp.]|uniref:LysE family translocator n=1 Tax=Mesorhizobium sp. TaxID=1871066 RepID=UPI0011F973C9|nr:LysE family translocator [Mesorhizobium sp.]TIL75273.1 MAG: LysE family translocator [Mesorhizobium sp.]TIL90464.1 MAG: LysE family translocator [Mesorhizobium sp.]TIM03190.1 MAG: LysE family translocator [Mesorhizobium sp.]TIM34013.1 MAG: LysE family translocator [Mesorhizobium sp.]
MLDSNAFTVYLFTAFLLAITPGPGIFYVAARTLSGGRSEGIASSLGNGLGGLFHVVAGSLGVSAIVLASAELFTALKVVGALYLVWMGYRTIRHARLDYKSLGHSEPPVGTMRAFRDGVLVEVMNPKTAAFFLAFIPQFVDASSDHVVLQFLILGAISVALNTLADIVVAFAAGRLRDGAASRGNLVRRLREGSGGAMIMLGCGLLLARRPVA